VERFIFLSTRVSYTATKASMLHFDKSKEVSDSWRGLSSDRPLHRENRCG